MSLSAMSPSVSQARTDPDSPPLLLLGAAKNGWLARTSAAGTAGRRWRRQQHQQHPEGGAHAAAAAMAAGRCAPAGGQRDGPGIGSTTVATRSCGGGCCTTLPDVLIGACKPASRGGHNGARGRTDSRGSRILANRHDVCLAQARHSRVGALHDTYSINTDRSGTRASARRTWTPWPTRWRWPRPSRRRVS